MAAKWKIWLRTLLTLGVANLLRVGIYKAGIKLGLHPVLWIDAQTPVGPFYDAVASSRTDAIRASGLPAVERWNATGLWFSAHEFPLPGGMPPDWFANPFRSGARGRDDVPWHKLPDFDPALGDIKTVWEASRFDWVLAMASRVALGDIAELARLNGWLDDWLKCNPPYFGVNWKCGQEASIRVLHLLTAVIQLQQIEGANKSLLALVELHLKRIAPTMGYAIGQANNHGTSEAAALFVGGSWLNRHGVTRGKDWERKGRYWLEERALKLISKDGTFSQYSVNYHRMVLDTFSISEKWRQELNLEPFSPEVIDRLAAATAWLESVVDLSNGGAPNLGANDGTEILKLSNNSYRDFRPSLQRASLLFRSKTAVYGNGIWDDASRWLGIDVNMPVADQPGSSTFDDGGLHVLRIGKALAVMRYPRFRFRPSQADALHVDLWLDGNNLLRDGGTLSYAAAAADIAYYSGVASHNTVQFDGRDQMPRLGRFLFGDWLKTKKSVPFVQTAHHAEASAEYVDAEGASHFRTVSLGRSFLHVKDSIGGFRDTAVLRWRLAPAEYRIENDMVIGPKLRLEIVCNQPIKRFELVGGFESSDYFRQSALPVLEIEVSDSCVIETRCEF